MSETAIPALASTAGTKKAATRGAFVPRLVAGLSIALAWEIVVRAFAPAYVAKPTTVLMAIPRVIVDPAFLDATAITLIAVAEGLAAALAAGTAIGLMMGRSVVIERVLRHYINGFYAMPMIIVLPLFSLWFGYSGAARIATIIFAAIFSIIVNVADGARSVPREYLDVDARHGRDRPAGSDALFARRLPPRRGACPDRGGRVRIFPVGRRARLFHPL